ncbi:UPF0175 family protein [Halosegnis longus]|uniref:UPF0175 family protein n=1 Tax=Halosegnis longus TaxID=2216012 RepID=UPI00129D6693|nr:UPF0175 family protein [Halosegnis longus]
MPTIEIDDTIYDALRLPEEERSQRLVQELAIALYAQNLLSFANARELADRTPQQFHALLGEREIPRHYTGAELAEDRCYAE